MNDTSSNTLSVLIIDDQVIDNDGAHNRRRSYEDWVERLKPYLRKRGFSDVIPHFMSDLSDFPSEDVLSKYRLAVVDMVLVPWPTYAVDKLDERLLRESWPLLLVSQKFNEDVAVARVQRFFEKSNAQVQLSKWERLNANNSNDADYFAFLISQMIANAHGISAQLEKGPDDSIEILHITDPHFGLASWYPNELYKLKLARKNQGLGVADFLCVTGDIANTCSPSEYVTAKEYLVALVDNDIVSRHPLHILDPEKVFLCPGNHDFNRQIALAANISAPNKQDYQLTNETKADKQWIVGEALSPYRKFQTDILKDTSDWIVKPGYQINSKFQLYGLIVLYLNLENYEIKNFQVGTDERTLLDRVDAAFLEARKCRNANDVLIVLTHYKGTNHWESIDRRLDACLESAGADGATVLFSGHTHNSKIVLEHASTCLHIQGRPSTEGPSQIQGSAPKIISMQLNRQADKVVEVIIKQFMLVDGGWTISANQPSISHEVRNGRFA